MRLALMAGLRRLRTWLFVRSCRSIESAGLDLHIGARARMWAPVGIRIGDHVYIGKDVHIECNADIGDYALIANRVAFVGRLDHDYHTVGIPVRFSPWVGSDRSDAGRTRNQVIVEDDVWVGFGAILLSGVRVGRGAIVASGAVVVKDVAPYTIVGGNPAREIGRRFSGDEVAAHERKVESGRFQSSERGYRYWLVNPGE